MLTPEKGFLFKLHFGEAQESFSADIGGGVLWFQCVIIRQVRRDCVMDYPKVYTNLKTFLVWLTTVVGKLSDLVTLVKVLYLSVHVFFIRGFLPYL